MPMPEDWKQSLPHIIALALLLFGLLLVLTKVGIVGCSSLGQSYCDLYYGIFGQPKILLVYDPSGPGIGDPQELERYLEDVKKINVRTVTVDQISSGMLDPYDVVIVEHAREIPTEKLKLFYDYVLNGMGRLVWVGDSGIISGSRDEMCRVVQYYAKWTTKDGTKDTENEIKVCVSTSEVPHGGESTASQFSMGMQQALYEKSWEELSRICADGFGGKLSNVKYTNGYHCYGTRQGYTNVFIKWENEEDFGQIVNPWDRGEFKFIGQQEKQAGIKFGTDILGVTFVSDAYAVSAYKKFAKNLSEMDTELQNAHTALVECTQSYSGETCDRAGLEAKMETKKSDLQRKINDVKTKLSSDISTLNSIKQQKDLAGEPTQKLAKAISLLQECKDITIDTMNLTKFEEASKLLTKLAPGENETVYANQLSDIAGKVAGYRESLLSSLTSYNAAKNELEQCGTPSTFLEKYSNATGIEKSKLATLFSLAGGASEEKKLEFITQVNAGEWAGISTKLKRSKFCPNASKAFSRVLEIASQLTPPGEENTVLATFKVEDSEHPLVLGITKSMDLVDKHQNPVPFVLVATGNPYTRVPASFEITPAYKGERLWPAITVRDPKYGSHVFGRGVVVYYAFPPETDEIFMDNLVKFILY